MGGLFYQDKLKKRKVYKEKKGSYILITRHLYDDYTPTL